MRFEPIIIAIVAISACGASASATDPHPGIYRSRATGSWNSSSTWQVYASGQWRNAESYPQTDDAATVRQHTVTLSQNVQVAFLTVEHDGVTCTGNNMLTVGGNNGLRIDAAGTNPRCGVVSVGASGTLKLSGGGDVQLDGQVVLGSCATLRFEGAQYALVGVGSVTGNHCSASILIDYGYTLANRILIEGAMQIDGFGGEATLSNETPSGIIRANGGEPFTFGVDLDLLDSDVGGVPSYEAVGPGSALVFTREDLYSGLLGDFLIDDCGTMCFEAAVATEGDLDHISGTVIVAPEAFFQWDSGSSTYQEGTHTVGDCEPAECDCD